MAKERAYLLFPRTDVSEVLGLQSRVKRVVRDKGNYLRVELEVPGTPNIQERVYYLDRNFKTVRLDFPERFVSLHRQLKHEGRLSDDLDRAEKQKLTLLESVPRDASPLLLSAPQDSK